MRKWAQQLVHARLNQTVVAHKESFTALQGYEIQNEICNLMHDQGYSIAAYKIGATNESSQARLHLEEPFFAPVFDINVGTLPDKSIRSDGWKGVEGEFGFILGKDIPVGERYTMSDAIECVGATVPVMELTQSRIQGGGSEQGLVIADGGNNGCLLVVPTNVKKDCRECDTIKVHTYINHILKASGSGKQVLNHPLNALLWFMNQKHRKTLKKGQLVSTGAANGAVTPIDNQHISITWENWTSSHLNLLN